MNIGFVLANYICYTAAAWVKDSAEKFTFYMEYGE